MEGMFEYCYYLNSLNLSSFDTRKVTNMKKMFVGCGYLTTIRTPKKSGKCTAVLPTIFKYNKRKAYKTLPKYSKKSIALKYS